MRQSRMGTDKRQSIHRRSKGAGPAEFTVKGYVRKETVKIARQECCFFLDELVAPRRIVKWLITATDHDPVVGGVPKVKVWRAGVPKQRLVLRHFDTGGYIFTHGRVSRLELD